jgi:hypothetical protein
MRTRLILIAVLATSLGACQSLGSKPPSEAARRQNDAEAYLAHPITRGQLVLHADFMLPPDHRLLSELVAERELVKQRLAIEPGSEPIHVHLFADEASYRQHVAREYPDFPERRAIFVETDVELHVYAHWGDAVADDLRHEVAHGYLHAAASNLPLWLDEGLAEYFEVGRTPHALNRPHVELLAGQLALGAWKPNLARLEQLASSADMTQMDYAESWLWVHLLLESSEEASGPLLELLAELSARQPAAPLSRRLHGQFADPDAALVAHLRQLRERL